VSEIKVLHCADLHIGAKESALKERATQRRAEMLLTFERIVEVAGENQVEILLISGDFLHNNSIESSVVERIFGIIASAPHIKFYFSAGNHDPLNFESPFTKNKLPENLFVFPTEDSVFEAKEGVKIYGKSFGEILNTGSEEFSLKADENDINIMCIHGEYGMNNQRNPITDTFIEKSNMDYMALGHIHKRSDIQKIGNTYFSYCGCPEGQGFDELGEKGVYILTVSKEDVKAQFVPTNKRMHIAMDIDISEANDTTDIYTKILGTISESIGGCYGDNLYKITLSGQVSDSVKIDTADISARLMQVVYFAKVVDNTVLKINLDELKNEMTLKGIFVKNMLKKIEENPEDFERLNKALKIGLNAFGKEEGAKV